MNFLDFRYSLNVRILANATPFLKENQNFELKELKMKNQRIFLLCQLVVSRGIDNEVKYILDQPFTDQNCP